MADRADLYDVLGVEASRTAIMTEAYKTLSEQGLTPDREHVRVRRREQVPVIRVLTLDQSRGQARGPDFEHRFACSEPHAELRLRRQHPLQLSQRASGNEHLLACGQHGALGQVTHGEPIRVGGDHLQPVVVGRAGRHVGIQRVGHLLGGRQVSDGEIEVDVLCAGYARLFADSSFFLPIAAAALTGVAVSRVLGRPEGSAELGWKAQESFESGLEKTVDWYLAREDWWRPLRQAYAGERLGTAKVAVALLVGARPRTKGMERGDLLEANGAIFTAQGKALNEVAADDIRIGVTGNPANTNALIAMTNAPDIPQERFSALTRLDHNRAISQLAAKTGAKVTDIKQMTIWGNHSATQYPDIFHAEIAGRNAAEVVNDQAWIENDFIPTVAKRGAAIIEARGSSSAASAASATIDAARDWLQGSPEGDWVSMAVVSDGSYGVPEGLISSFPVTTRNGDWEIVQGLEIDDFSRGKIDASTAELAEERAAVKDLGLI